MRTDAFDYHLPKSRIGQPPPQRDTSRLLVLDRKTGRMEDRTIRDLPDFLQPGDCVVLNETKVFRARLRGTVDGKTIELLLIRPDGKKEWIALGKPGKRFRIGSTVIVGKLRGAVRGRDADGSIRLTFDCPAATVIAYANRVGEIPIPPYVRGRIGRLADYQTTYARRTGSVAAPTAGFHITPRILRALRTNGVHIARVTLHVGLGTFQPIRAERLEDHRMHAEWVDVPAATARTIARAHAGGNRVIAIGTTTLRALEGYAAARELFPKSTIIATEDSHGRQFEGAWSGWVDLFIMPGFRFRVVDALLTNFHLPKSSLLVLVSAFAVPGARSLHGRDRILRAYRHAIQKQYRFYSFGDAMVIGDRIG